MQIFNFPTKSKKIILALSAESAGNFSVHIPSPLSRGGVGGGLIYFSEDFGDLLEEKNWLNFQKFVLNFIKKEKIKPNIIITDLHPLMKTTLWGKELAKKFKAQHIQVQHHHAHLFSAIGDSILPLPLLKGKVGRGFSQITSCELPDTSYGIALDGTGYGTDERIWGGEVFQLQTVNRKLRAERIGHLENQILIGGELAIQEPARMLVSILAKISKKNHQSSIINQKKFIYNFVKRYYTKNEFELLYNQLEQNFNCTETSSTGRILDAVSLLLGFCENERKYKHEAIDLLMTNSTKPYSNIRPQIKIANSSSMSNIQCSMLNKFPMTKFSNKKYILNTTYLFKYLIKNINKDKKRLAATAQLYLAQGLYEIVKKSSVISHQSSKKNQLSPTDVIFAAGGVTNNKIISNYFISKNIYLNTSVPRGDAGLSFGQIMHFLLNK